MGSVGVVVDPPVLDDHPGLVEVGEQVFVEALVAQPTVEALDEAVLHGLAGRDVGTPTRKAALRSRPWV